MIFKLECAYLIEEFNFEKLIVIYYFLESEDHSFHQIGKLGRVRAWAPGRTTVKGAYVVIHNTLVAERGDKEFSVT